MIFRIPRKVSLALPDLANLRVVGVSTIAVIITLLGVRHLGGLETLELAAYDQFVRLRPLETEPDPRILVVAITEQDLENQNQWPISDQVLAQVLRRLQAAEPAVIGLDLYRNLPVEPGHQQLVEQLQQPNLIAIQNIDIRAGTPPPPDVSPERIGFNDILLDPDDVVRRNYLFAENESESDVLYSFSLLLALAYLEPRGIELEPSPDNPDIPQLGAAVLSPITENAGGYQKGDVGGFQILLNYRSSYQVARQVSLTDVLAGKVDPSWVEDKIVIIGSTAPSLKDLFATPFSPALEKNAKIPGVLMQAQMVSQFLDAATGKRPLFWFWSEKAEILWIVGWIAIGGILGRVTYHPLALIIGVTGSLGVLSSVCFYLLTQSGWVPFAAPAFGFGLTVAIFVTHRSYEAHQQQQIVMKLLGQNTSPEVAQALWQGRDRLLKSGKLPGIRLTATMFFADIKDFSTISEKMTPEALLEWLNEILGVVTREVLQGQGIVNKFTGDGVMVAFGVPMSRLHRTEVAEDAKAAVDCALAISDRLESMNRDWRRRGLPVIQMRIGIFTGPVVVGSLGGKDRLEYGVIGDSVNIASRLESCEKQRQPTPCRILIGQQTLDQLQGEFEVESWGPLALKGKQQTVNVYRVLARTPILE
ncbi:CHASE2 domain-containing protein [Coleofasciculus chthonoplastes]|uniref:CHASE2 domain-containing protein n=1 Tax=Coleofasciculus chthonoplastes TaxID=64178 RepID=UPI0032F3A612